MINEDGADGLNINFLGSAAFIVQESQTSEKNQISFDFSCDRQKLIWAQQTFLELPVVLYQERNKPLLVKDVEKAKNWCTVLRHICDYWELHLPYTPQWNWTEEHVTAFLQSKMLKHDFSGGDGSLIYSRSRLHQFARIFNIGHKALLDGKSSDGLSFPITDRLKQLIMRPILNDFGLTFEEWIRGQSHPPVPLGIASVILSRAIELLESEETAIALSLYASWRKTHNYYDLWFRKNKPDIIQLALLDEQNPFGIIEELKSNNVEHTTKLPWKLKNNFRIFRRRLIGACINIIFIQSGHRYHEFQSTVSNDRRHRRGLLMVKQRLDKSLGGFQVYRPLAKLSTKAAETLWHLSFIDPNTFPVPLQHSLHDSGYARVWPDKLPEEALTPCNNFSLNERLNAFYQSDVLPLIPEAHNIHPRLSTHQYRHTFAEFVLRRFDEDVHESLREHFVHDSDFATLIYERWKLSPAVQSMLEKKYLFEIIGKTAEGKLDERFWGPAYQRLRGLTDNIKLLHPQNLEEHYQKILDEIERFAVFEWGYCVLFSTSKLEARCHDSITGLPEVDILASPRRCTGCPNNMGNSIQKNNLLRIELTYSEIGRAHPIKAVGKLFSDIANQISRRTSGKK